MKGIWQYNSKFINEIPIQFQLTLNEGDVSFEKGELNDYPLYILREDLNPNGSHKDRSLAYQISYYLSKGITNLAITSTGNASISAIAYSKLAPEVKLTVFVSEKLSESKKARLPKGDYDIVYAKNPKGECMKFCRETGAVNLRGSTNDTAIEGFKTIGFEIEKYQQENNLKFDAVFTPTSSATSAIGIHHGSPKTPIHIAQTTKVNTIAREFDTDFEPTKDSICDCISDRVGHRKNEIIEIIKKTGGSGWVVNDKLVTRAYKLLEAQGIHCSIEGGLSLGAYLKARSKGLVFQNPLIVITGTK